MLEKVTCPVTNIQNRLGELPVDMSSHLQYENSLDSYFIRTCTILDG